jgi:CheY-like chemotaxis protein
VFRVRPPAATPERLEAKPAAQPVAAPAVQPVAAPAPTPAAPAADAGAAPRTRVLIGAPEAEAGKLAAAFLERRGIEALVVHDGVEAMLEIQRKQPRAAVLWASLPRMFGFQICEIVKRNESLRGIGVVLVGEIHDSQRYRRPANDLYGADCYIEEPDVPEGLPALLDGLGVPLAPPAAPVRELPPAPAPAPAAPPAPAPLAAPPSPVAAPSAPAPASAPIAAPASAPRGDGLDEQRAQAGRLARIIVSDIVLYNEAKFSEALRRGNVLTALEGELAEGRSLFRERIDERVRAERDHLAEELVRVARSRGMAG